MGVRTAGDYHQDRWKWRMIVVLIIVAGGVLPLERGLWEFSGRIAGKGVEGKNRDRIISFR